jgi:hypothetical protein
MQVFEAAQLKGAALQAIHAGGHHRQTSAAVTRVDRGGLPPAGASDHHDDAALPMLLVEDFSGVQLCSPGQKTRRIRMIDDIRQRLVHRQQDVDAFLGWCRVRKLA